MEIFNDFCRAVRARCRSSTRYGHVLAGVTWIGLLYFFNFVQVPAYAELSDGARSEALRKLTFRALWWFRYAALLTFLFGLMLLVIQGDGENMDLYFEGAHGTAILTGMLFGITMFLNVWGVIWRNQKIVIGNAENVAAGGEAEPGRAGRRQGGRPGVAVQHPVLDPDAVVHGVRRPRRRLLRRRDRGHDRLLGARARAVGVHRGVGARAHRRHRQPVQQGGLRQAPATRSSAGFVLLAVIYFVGWELILAAREAGAQLRR